MSRHTTARWILARAEHPHIPGVPDPSDLGVWIRLVSSYDPDSMDMPTIALTESLVPMTISHRGPRFIRAN